MQFIGMSGSFGTAAFEYVVYPMPDLAHYKPKSAQKKRMLNMLKAPKPPSQILKNFLLNYDK